MAAGLREWGRTATEYMENFNRLAGVFITGEDPPQAVNRITLHPTQRDDYGLAIPIIEYAQHPNSVAMQEHSIRQTTALYESIGGADVRASRGVGRACHNLGTARMSANPEEGVTNRWGQVHEVPNLFVSDGGVFTSSAAAKPDADDRRPGDSPGGPHC